MKLLAAGLLLGSLAATAWAQEPSAKGVNFYSIERERELGGRAAANLERVLPVVHEPKVDAYIAQLGAALAKYSNSPFAYTFTVYEDRRPGGNPLKSGLTSPAGAGAAMPMDAFQGQAAEPEAIAGGPIFVPLSLLADAPSEAVFAFELAHAMAHVALRHATKQATRTELLQLPASTTQNVAMAGQWPTGVPLSLLTFARAFEREADYVAVRIVSEAGYSPEEMAAYLGGQVAPKSGTVSSAFSAHPTPSQRSKAIRAEFENLPAATYNAAGKGFAEARAMAAGIH